MIVTMLSQKLRDIAGAVVWLGVASSALAQGPVAPAPLSAAEILERVQRHSESQAAELKHYQALRHYHVEYRGYSKSIAAQMDVEVDFDAASGKSFRIVSQSGSRLLCDKVLKRAVDSEREAAGQREATALTAGNYRFELAGVETLAGRPAYVLRVDPVTENKFLYRGRIWVDAEDFAVAKIDAEPARNPSFWISRAQIENTNAKTAGFWLPQNTRSESRIRIGGTAVLTIDYGTYRIAASPPHAVAQGARSAPKATSSGM